MPDNKPLDPEIDADYLPDEPERFEELLVRLERLDAVLRIVAGHCSMVLSPQGRKTINEFLEKSE